jgi:hypothetical protein
LNFYRAALNGDEKAGLNQKEGKGGTAVSDDELESLKKRVEELERKLQEPASPPVAPVTPERQMSSARTVFNPEISVIGDFTWRINYDKERDGGQPFSMRELEFGIQSYIDPFSRADIFLGLHKEDQQSASGGEYHLHLEEAYATLFRLPLETQGKVGKYKMNFGNANATHLHALETVDYPLMVKNFFGEEGLSTTGASLSALLPFSFSSEFTLQTGNEENDTSFSGGQNGKLLFLGRWNNYWDVTDATNFSLGFSYLSGYNDPAASSLSRLWGGDLTWRWKPLREGMYKSFLWRTEYLKSQRDSHDASTASQGYYSLMQYQLNRCFYVGARYDYAEYPEDNKNNEKGASFFFNYYPTEFMRYELQHSQIDNTLRGLTPEWWFRMIFILGPHGAHKF